MNNSNKDNSNNYRLSQSFSPMSRHMQIEQNASDMQLKSSSQVAFIKTNDNQEPIPGRNQGEELTERFRNQLEYNILLTAYPEKKPLVDEIIINMVDMWICQEVRIKGQSKPQAIVRGVLAKLMKPQAIVRGVLAKLMKPQAIWVMEKLATIDVGIKNRGGYLQTMLYMSVLEEQVHQAHTGNQSGQDAALNATGNRSIQLSIPNAETNRKILVSNRNNFQQREYDDSFFQ